MNRILNYTLRKKIPAECIQLNVFTVNGSTYFNAVLDTDRLYLPAGAKVYIEAYYRSASLRFSFGEISSVRQPDDTDISELKKISDKIYFRIKVIDVINCLILAFADNIRLADDDIKEKTSILYVNAVRMNTNEIWRVNFDTAGDGTPVLEINNEIDGIRDIARGDPKFLSLVYPAAVRMILQKIADEDDFDRDGESWSAKWIIFTENILGVEGTPESGEDEEQIIQWIDDVVRAFCLKYRLLEHFIKTSA